MIPDNLSPLQARVLAAALERVIDLLIEAYSQLVRRYPIAAEPPDPADWTTGFDHEIPF